MRPPDDPRVAAPAVPCSPSARTPNRQQVPIPVTTIFLEPNLLALEQSDEATTQLRYLAESGAELVVVSDRPLAEWDELGVPSLRYEPSAARGRRGDWWLTADPADCARRPGRGVVSMLIGGTLGASVGPTARCDLGARDLRGAVLEILSREAMPKAPGPAAVG
jgi:hypothetical protein